MKSIIIEKDGIRMERSGSVLDWILCGLLSMHDWRYWRMSPEYESAFRNDRSVQRTCARCGWMEMADVPATGWTRDQKQIWKGRA